MKVVRKLKSMSIVLVTISYLMFSAYYSSAQGIGINSVGTAPDASALLDLNSTNKGFLITRVDTLNIPSPAFGLLTLSPVDSCLYLFNGKRWMGMGGGGSDCSCNCGSSSPSPSACGSPFIDARDGEKYGTVEIGKQCWMSENLAYLPSVTATNTGSTADPHYYVYGYNGTDVTAAKNEANYSTYGVLYNWPAAMAGASSSIANPSGVQGACPDGWHLPSDEEWKELEMTVGMSQADADAIGFRGNVADKLKTSVWGGNNSSGFTALPAGRRSISTSSWNVIEKDALWWTATEDNGTESWTRLMKDNENRIYRSTPRKLNNAYSVRCVKD